jgi:predicted DNA-binding transcriptional regulator AlpA
MSPFMKRREVEKVHPIPDQARARAEQFGLFPKRVRLAPKISGWRRSEVDDWLNDPAAWAERNRNSSAA